MNVFVLYVVIFSGGGSGNAMCFDFVHVHFLSCDCYPKCEPKGCHLVIKSITILVCWAGNFLAKLVTDADILCVIELLTCCYLGL